MRPGTRCALLSLGLGFQGQLTGRDNARLSSILQGSSAKAAESALQQIQDFSELGASFDEPVKTYSAGMRARLGFATSIFTHVDILIGKDFTGNLPDNIDSITITGPKGELPFTKADFTYYPQFKGFFINIPGSPEIGRYSFTLTSDNLKASASDTLSVHRSIPIPQSSSLYPAEGAVIRSRNPVFSWNAVEYEKAPLYYRIEIWNPPITERAYASRFEKNMLSHTIPAGKLKAGKIYRWRVRVADGYNWERVQNLSHSEWQTITVAHELE